MNHLINKYSNLPVQVKAAFWFTVCSVVQNGCKFLAMPVLVRLLTTEEFGIYSVFLSWFSIISVFATLNMFAGVFSNAMFKFENNRDEYTSCAQSISITSTVLLLLIYLLIKDFWNSILGLPEIYSLLIFVQLLFTEGFLVWSSRQKFEYRYIPLIIYTSILSVLNLILPIAAAYIFPPEQRLNAVVFVGSAVQIIFGFVFIVYNYIKGRCFFKKEYWIFALSFNLPLIPHYLSGIVLGHADRVMIKNMISPDIAGIYSFTYNVSLVMNIITQSVNSAIVPYTYRKIKDNDFGRLRSVSNLLLIMVGALVVMFSVVAPEFIKIFATVEYYKAIPLVPIISLSSYFTFMQCLFGNVEFYFEEKKFVMIASVIAAITNVVLNYLLIPVWGFYAAGCTTLACYMISCLAYYLFMRRVCQKHKIIDDIYGYKAIFTITILVLAITLGMLLVYDFWYIRYSFLIAVLAVIVVKRNAIIDVFKMMKEKKL